jgi:hypothetical protein
MAADAWVGRDPCWPPSTLVENTAYALQPAKGMYVIANSNDEVGKVRDFLRGIGAHWVRFVMGSAFAHLRGKGIR